MEFTTAFWTSYFTFITACNINSGTQLAAACTIQIRTNYDNRYGHGTAREDFWMVHEWFCSWNRVGYSQLHSTLAILGLD